MSRQLGIVLCIRWGLQMVVPWRLLSVGWETTVSWQASVLRVGTSSNPIQTMACIW